MGSALAACLLGDQRAAVTGRDALAPLFLHSSCISRPCVHETALDEFIFSSIHLLRISSCSLRFYSKFF